MAALQELLDCRISAWYPQFARVTFKTALLPLPQPVLDWLVSDGLHLPADSQAFAKRGQLEEYPTEDDYQDWQSEDGSASEASSAAAAQPPPPELAKLMEQVQGAIAELGGRVLPKLTWSCPKDAVWMSPSSSLCCTTADEVLLLLRSSDRVAHDICHALQEAAAAAAAGQLAAAAGEGASDGAPCEGASEAPSLPPLAQHCLALRRWYDLQPGREFRCFVRGQALVGACQRDVTQCFEFLKGEQAELADALQAFHAKHIQGRFPHPNYAYDAYVASSGAVRLVDFNPVGGTTAPLLFTWHELGLGGGSSGGGSAAAEGEAAAGEVADEAAGDAAGHAASAAGADAAPQACCSCGQGTAGATAAAAESPAAADTAPDYLHQLRRVQALSLTEQQQQQPEEQDLLEGHASAVAVAPGAAAASAAPAPEAAASIASSGGGAPASACPQSSASPRFELRVIEESVALRPTTLAYGVPFDFVDSSEGSALDRLMAQSQAAGAGELWEALAAGRQGGDAGGGASV